MLSPNIAKAKATTAAMAENISDPTDQPRQHPDHAAGRNRSEQPAQHGAQHAADDEDSRR